MLLKPAGLLKAVSGGGAGPTITSLGADVVTTNSTGSTHTYDLSAYDTGDILAMFLGCEANVPSVTVDTGGGAVAASPQGDSDSADTGVSGGTPPGQRGGLYVFTLTGPGGAATDIDVTWDPITNEKMIDPFMIEGGTIGHVSRGWTSSDSAFTGTETPVGDNAAIIMSIMAETGYFGSGITVTNGTKATSETPAATTNYSLVSAVAEGLTGGVAAGPTMTPSSNSAVDLILQRFVVEEA